MYKKSHTKKKPSGSKYKHECEAMGIRVGWGDYTFGFLFYILGIKEKDCWRLTICHACKNTISLQLYLFMDQLLFSSIMYKVELLIIVSFFSHISFQVSKRPYMCLNIEYLDFFKESSSTHQFLRLFFLRSF